jgi:hypothetical protein
MGINKEGYQLVYDDSIRNHPSILHCIQIKYPKMIKEIPLTTPPPPQQQPLLQQRQDEDPEFAQELDMITLDSGDGVGDEEDDFLNSNNKNNINNINSLNCDHLNEVVSLKKLDFELSLKNIVSSEEELDCPSSDTINNDIHGYLHDTDMNTVSNPITPSKLDDDLFEQSLFRLAEQQEQQQQFPTTTLPLADVFTTPPAARTVGIEQQVEGGEEAEIVFTASELQFILEETAIFSPPPALSLTTEVEEENQLKPQEEENINSRLMETGPKKQREGNDEEVKEKQLEENINNEMMEISTKEQGEREEDIVLEDLLPSCHKVTQPDDWYWFEQQEPLHEAGQVETKGEKELEEPQKDRPLEIPETEKEVTINSRDQPQFPVSECLKNEQEEEKEEEQEKKIEPVLPNSSSSVMTNISSPPPSSSSSSHAVFHFPIMPDDWYWSSSSSSNKLVLNNNNNNNNNNNREDRNHREDEELNLQPKKKMKANQENTSGETSFSPYFPDSLRVEITKGYFKRITRSTSTSTATDKQ